MSATTLIVAHPLTTRRARLVHYDPRTHRRTAVDVFAMPGAAGLYAGALFDVLAWGFQTGRGLVP